MDDKARWVIVERYYTVILLLVILSYIGIIIHLHKFIRSKSGQTLASKLLALYCLILLPLYSFPLNGSICVVFSSYCLPQKIVPYTWPTYGYLMSLTVCLKSMIALDICLTFRRIALGLQSLSTARSQNMKFVFYSISSLAVPLMYTILASIFVPLKNIYQIQTFCMTIIRILRLFPIIGSFWYLKLAGIGKIMVLKMFPIHVRLLVLIGGFSTILDAVELINKAFNTSGITLWTLTITDFHYAGICLEGIVIVGLFTFKKYTFQITSGNSPEITIGLSGMASTETT